MADTIQPADEKGVQDAVAAALSDAMPLEIVGGGTKRTLGHPVSASGILSLSALSGIVSYEPEELVITVRPGTTLEEVEAALADRNQCFAFEPPDWRGLLGSDGRQTVGGVVATNQSGPRRLRAGAARDHVLGARIVTGLAETVKIGGKVVKNVTGYDLCKLIAGSYGTLAVMTEITLKTLPAGEKTRTVLLFGQDHAAAQAAMTEALHSPNDISAAAYVPEAIAGRSGVGYVANSNAAVTAVRVEGPEPSVAARCAALRDLLGRHGDVEELHFHNSRKFWAEAGDVSAFADGSDPVWRLSIPPASAPGTVARIAADIDCDFFADWGGGLVWLKPRGAAEDAGASTVRNAIADTGGHATLIRASEELRRQVPVFQPQPAALGALSARIRDGYDPAHILNPGRMSLQTTLQTTLPTTVRTGEGG